jgi:hypothetical protein
MINWLNTNAAVVSLIFSAVVAGSTVVYACLTAMLVSETHRMRQLQMQPRIEVTLQPREEWMNLISMHVRNIGLGPAYDISFELVPEAPSEGALKLIADFSTSQFLNTGLRYLARPIHERAAPFV